MLGYKKKKNRFYYIIIHKTNLMKQLRTLFLYFDK